MALVLWSRVRTLRQLITLWRKYTYPSFESMFMPWPQMDLVGGWPIPLPHSLKLALRKGVSYADGAQVGDPGLCCKATHQDIITPPRCLRGDWPQIGAGASQPFISHVALGRAHYLHPMCSCFSILKEKKKITQHNLERSNLLGSGTQWASFTFIQSSPYP